MISDFCWLPKQESFDNYGNSWNKYEEALYSIFKNDFIDSKPFFKDKQVNIRRHPIEYGKEEAFFHITCQDYEKEGNRVPDFRRCERIRWVRAFIENYNCKLPFCEMCEGVKVWSEPYKNNSRIHILLEEEKYMVVIECRKSYYLLVTAFYFDHEHTLKKKLKRYEKYKNNYIENNN